MGISDRGILSPQYILAQKKEIRDRRRRVTKAILERPGITQRELAAKEGVKQNTISGDIKVIMDEWVNTDVRRTKVKVAYLSHQLLHLISESYQSYLRSRQDEEEVTTRIEPHPCRDCKSTGKINDKECKRCEGTGKMNEEIVTRRIKGQAGDATFIRVCLDAWKEWGRINGCRVAAQAPLTLKKSQEIHIHGGTGSGGVDWSKVPADTLLKMKKVLEEAKRLNVLDVESEETEPDDEQREPNLLKEEK